MILVASPTARVSSSLWMMHAQLASGAYTLRYSDIMPGCVCHTLVRNRILPRVCTPVNTPLHHLTSGFISDTTPRNATKLSLPLTQKNCSVSPKNGELLQEANSTMKNKALLHTENTAWCTVVIGTKST